MTHPVPLCVIVPSFLMMAYQLPSDAVTVQVPPETINPPLIKKSLPAAPLDAPISIDGFVPRSTVHPDAMLIVCPMPGLLISTKQLRVPVQVTVESSVPSEPSNVTVFPVFVKVPPDTVKLRSMVMPPLELVKEPRDMLKLPSFKSMTLSDPVKVPPLTVKLIVVIVFPTPWERVPAVRVRVASTSRLPERLKVPADLLIVRLLKSCPTPVPPVVKVWSLPPSNVTVFVPEVKVPRLDQLPAIFMA